MATIHPRVRVYGDIKAYLGCMADRYCGGTFHPPTHHGTSNLKLGHLGAFHSMASGIQVYSYYLYFSGVIITWDIHT